MGNTRDKGGEWDGGSDGWREESQVVYSTTTHDAAPCGTVQYSTVQHSTARRSYEYSSVQHTGALSTAQQSVQHQYSVSTVSVQYERSYCPVLACPRQECQESVIACLPARTLPAKPPMTFIPADLRLSTFGTWCFPYSTSRARHSVSCTFNNQNRPDPSRLAPSQFSSIMKLDTRAIRYLTSEDWRVLTAVCTSPVFPQPPPSHHSLNSSD